MIVLSWQFLLEPPLEEHDVVRIIKDVKPLNANADFDLKTGMTGTIIAIYRNKQTNKQSTRI